MNEISSANDSRLATGKVCLIVSAPWCGVCRMMKPSFEKMASAAEDILFMTADADKTPDIAPKYGIKALPTAVLLRDGELVKTLHGGEISSSNVNSSF